VFLLCRVCENTDLWVGLCLSWMVRLPHPLSYGFQALGAEFLPGENLCYRIEDSFVYQVWEESSLGFPVRVTDVVTCCWMLAAVFADSGHGFSSSSK